MSKWKILGWCVFLLGSCCPSGNEDSRLETALQLSGANRMELEKVLQHFSGHPADSLKLKAAVFLIENMPGHWQPDHNGIRNYLTRLDTLKPLSPLTRKVLLTYPAEHPELCPDFTPIEDIKHLKADFLIRHIQSVFALKDSCPWLANIEFDAFCEYLLPYRIGHEVLEDSPAPSRDSDFYRAVEYAKCYYDDCQHSIQALSFYLEKLHFPSVLPKNDTLLYDLLLTDTNTTKESLIRYRAIGLPVSTDFSPIHRHQDKITYWICYQDPRIHHSNIYTIGNLRASKIYRKTFSSNPIPQTTAYVPVFFRDPFNKDVTHLYLPTADVQINIPPTVTETYAYLAVYDDQKWQPIAYSRVREGKCDFSKLGRHCIYLPIHYPDTEMQAFASPFILRNDHKIHPLHINKDSLITLKIRRLHPYAIQKDYMNEYLRNARFECADRADFQHPDTVFTVKKLNYYHYDTIRPDIRLKKRYWRIIPPLGVAYLSELYFHDLSGNVLQGTPIGPHPKQYQKLTDHDPGSSKFVNLWFGYDFGKPVSVSEIIYLNFNDNENIRADQEYELLYWENGQWQSAGIQMASEPWVEYNHVPSSTLYQMKDLTRNSNGCLFTYENGEIRFW